MLEFDRNNRGRPLVTAACDSPGCDHQDTFACQFNHAGQARKHLQAAGWNVSRKKLICPAHHQKDAEDMKEVETVERRPTRQQKREIMDMLQACYDTSNERYVGSDNDDSVAVALNVLPAWVEEIREEFFGALGANENVDDLVARLDAWDREFKMLTESHELLRADMRGLVERVEAQEKQIATARKQMAEIRAEVTRVQSALSPRLRKKAAV